MPLVRMSLAASVVALHREHSENECKCIEHTLLISVRFFKAIRTYGEPLQTEAVILMPRFHPSGFWTSRVLEREIDLWEAYLGEVGLWNCCPICQPCCLKMFIESILFKHTMLRYVNIL